MMIRNAIKYGLLSWILVAAVGGLVYWGNGNADLPVQAPQVTVIHDNTKEIERLKKEVTDRDHLIQHLKAQVKTRNFVIKEYEARLAKLNQEVKPQPVILEEVKQVVMTKGLHHETHRVLDGIIDVSRVRLTQ